MATLTVWKFDAPEGAGTVEDTLLQLQKQQLIKVIDAATVSWPAEANKPKTKQLYNLTGALSGTFWGMLFGLLFFMPLLGAAVGAAACALGGKMADVGIDDDFIDSVKSKVTPGSSALFLLSADAVVDRVKDAFPNGHAELIQSNLDTEKEAKLREVFAG
ncbi:putative membrane protein [Streptomyces venezuelae]|uniref:DUF1269 domain-containing protein n=1 Tax=Streptomyces gardneri TaxID=66892 RepID=UPI0006BD86B8|nr:DUF1269 domain-containing protein [Streptomyces gardneri]ALO09825.1 putative membrane protein [Streptomyces venezuelae]QPK46884.1 DUF1269 domain-containing protein [Streptomyces gardneri]WRK38290.1 DUF1269 domain-containing protein [Streptomyces venezuelae]CUM39740.1 FIG01127956: hypothetical protein [Streptomyces venezuelae]